MSLYRAHCALAFSYRSQVELGRKVGITYTTSSHGLQLAWFGRTVTGLLVLRLGIGAERFALKVHSFDGVIAEASVLHS